MGAFACMSGKSGLIARRVLAGATFALCILYVWQEAGGGKLFSTKRSDTSLRNALLAFWFFGVPSGYYLLLGKLPGFSWVARLMDRNREASDKQFEENRYL